MVFNEVELEQKLEILEHQGLLAAPEKMLRALQKHPDDLPLPQMFRWTAAPIKSKYAQAERLDAEELDFYRNLHHKVVLGGAQPEPAELKQLQLMIQKYPELPFLENLLANLWKLSSNREKYRLINERMMEKFPDYLFARTNLAEELLAQDKSDLIPELLNHCFEIYTWDQDPDRLFHISELAGFYSVIAAWALLTERNLRAAWAFSLLYHAYPAFDGVPRLVERWLRVSESERDALGKQIKGNSKLTRKKKSLKRSSLNLSQFQPEDTSPAY